MINELDTPICYTCVILDLIALEFPERDITLAYAIALRAALSGESAPDWNQINEAIIKRWSFSVLERVKGFAHRLIGL